VHAGEVALRSADLEAWRRFLEGRNLDPALASVWAGHARPNIRLVPSAVQDTDDTQPRTSKLGGLPDLRLGAPWPMRPAYEERKPTGLFRRRQVRAARPLSFLAQIDLRDIAAAGCDLPLPDAGLLLFFYDLTAQPWGFDPLDGPGAQSLLQPVPGRQRLAWIALHRAYARRRSRLR
jgi:hypothetical protein